jgi:histidinol phosphatase-like PHP family hydrolase
LFLYSYTSSNQQFREFDSFALDVSKRIIEAAISNDVALEINAGGVAKGKYMIHGKYEYIYPRTEFWNVVKEYQKHHNVKVVIGADAHTPNALGDQYYDETVAFAHKLGIKVLDKLKF